MKKLSVLLVALALVACVGVYATVAYFTDTAKVINTFTVGKVKITLDETRVDTSGVEIPDSTRTPEGNDYHLVPGHTYVKDPTLNILEGSEPSYFRMQVTINHISELKTMLNDDLTEAMPFIGSIGTNWKYYGYYDNTDNTRTYEYRYELIMDGFSGFTKTTLLFESFTVPGYLTGDQLNKLTNDFKIEIVGHAIQAEGFGNANEAWNAFGSKPTGTLTTPVPATPTDSPTTYSLVDEQPVNEQPQVTESANTESTNT